MVLHRFACFSLLLLLTSACQPKPAPPAPAPSEPASEEVLRAIRASYRAIDANTRVGLVTAVAPDVELVAVGEMDIAALREGDYITIIDPQQNIIANGRVVAVTHNALHVRYDTAGATRTPRTGDLAVAATLPR